MRNLSLTGLTYFHIEFYSYLRNKTKVASSETDGYFDDSLFHMFYQAAASDFCSTK